MGSQDDDSDMLLLKSSHENFQKRSEKKKKQHRYKYNGLYIAQDSHSISVLKRLNLIQS